MISAGRHSARQRVEPFPRRAAREAVAFEVQAVEEERLHRQLGAQLLHVELAAEATHRDLERTRPAVGRERDRLAVEDHLARRQGLHRLDDFRHRRRHFVRAARVDAHLVARLVQLDARTVHLPFECDFAAELRQRFADVGGGLRQHRRDRRQRLQLKLRERRRALGQCSARDRAEILRVHGRAPDLVDGYLGRSGDCIEHDAFERALPQLADQQPDQEFLLVARRTSEQGLQRLRAPGRRARTAQRRHVCDAAVDLVDRQRCRVCRPARLAGLAQGRVADAEAPLRDFA